VADLLRWHRSRTEHPGALFHHIETDNCLKIGHQMQTNDTRHFSSRVDGRRQFSQEPLIDYSSQNFLDNTWIAGVTMDLNRRLIKHSTNSVNYVSIRNTFHPAFVRFCSGNPWVCRKMSPKQPEKHLPFDCSFPLHKSLIISLVQILGMRIFLWYTTDSAVVPEESPNAVHADSIIITGDVVSNQRFRIAYCG